MKKRKKQLKKAVLSVTAATMMLGSSLPVSAAGLGDVFDAGYYADTYADLKAAFGDDADALLQHYLTYGVSEGRAGRADFNVSQYRSAYADLDAAFGDDWNAYADHYLTYGIAEGRTGVTSPAGTPATGAAGQETQTPEQTQTGTPQETGTGNIPTPVGNNPVRENAFPMPDMFSEGDNNLYLDTERWSFIDGNEEIWLSIPSDAVAVMEKDAYGVTYRCYHSPRVREVSEEYPNIRARACTGDANRKVMSRVAEYAAANEKFAAVLASHGNRIVFVDNGAVRDADPRFEGEVIDVGGVYSLKYEIAYYWTCRWVDCNPADCLYVFVDSEIMDSEGPQEWEELFNTLTYELSE